MLMNEDKIQEMIDSDETFLKRPVTAFVTFNLQEGYERCLENF